MIPVLFIFLIAGVAVLVSYKCAAEVWEKCHSLKRGILRPGKDKH
jgi:hypothetical protein